MIETYTDEELLSIRREYCDLLDHRGSEIFISVKQGEFLYVDPEYDLSYQLFDLEEIELSPDRKECTFWNSSYRHFYDYFKPRKQLLRKNTLPRTASTQLPGYYSLNNPGSKNYQIADEYLLNHLKDLILDLNVFVTSDYGTLFEYYTDKSFSTFVDSL